MNAAFVQGYIRLTQRCYSNTYLLVIPNYSIFNYSIARIQILKDKHT